ncbi:thiol:disulfide interchange protein TlpA [Pseudochrobactrum sp. MP213Fo]|uniref:thiol:disulfide interchange protein TlpA n=1 Tax=Pseudochrobactrum sp. MP213Fo TaxID=3022250 RepID=UPI003BA14F38
MAEDNKKTKPQSVISPKMILLAGVAGLLAGAVAVYVMEPPSGNVVPAVASIDSTANNQKCALNQDQLARLTAAATGAVAAMQPADMPVSLKTMQFDAPDGAKISIADRQGKTLLVNLWASWCAPCREEMPALDELQAAQGGADFEVIAINIDTGDDTKPKAFLNEIGVQKLGFYRDATMGVFNDLKRKNLAFGLPVTLLIDDQGCQVAAMNGPADWAGQDAVKLINAAKSLRKQ